MKKYDIPVGKKYFDKRIGKRCQVVADENCDRCIHAFGDENCAFMRCSDIYRKDKTPVKFIEVTE